MKSSPKWIALVGVVLAVSVGSTAVQAVTVGEFVRSTAQLVGVQPATAEGMRAAGYAVPESNLNASLTEADLVTIGAALGVPLQTQTPRASVSDRRAERMLAYLGTRALPRGETQSARRGDNSSGPSDPKKRPRSRSPRRPNHSHGHPR